MREFRPRIGLEHALAAFVYAFSPFTTQFLLPSPSSSPTRSPRGSRGSRSAACADGDPWRWAAAFALAIAAVGAFNVAALGFALVPAALIALYFSLYERRGLGQLWGWAWRAGLLSVLTCSAGARRALVLGAGCERQPAHDGAPRGRGPHILVVRELARPRLLAHLLP